MNGLPRNYTCTPDIDILAEWWWLPSLGLLDKAQAQLFVGFEAMICRGTQQWRVAKPIESTKVGKEKCVKKTLGSTKIMGDSEFYNPDVPYTWNVQVELGPLQGFEPNNIVRTEWSRDVRDTSNKLNMFPNHLRARTPFLMAYIKFQMREGKTSNIKQLWM